MVSRTQRQLDQLSRDARQGKASGHITKQPACSQSVMAGQEEPHRQPPAPPAGADTPLCAPASARGCMLCCSSTPCRSRRNASGRVWHRSRGRRRRAAGGRGWPPGHVPRWRPAARLHHLSRRVVAVQAPRAPHHGLLQYCMREGGRCTRSVVIGTTRRANTDVGTRGWLCEAALALFTTDQLGKLKGCMPAYLPASRVLSARSAALRSSSFSLL